MLQTLPHPKENLGISQCVGAWEGLEWGGRPGEKEAWMEPSQLWGLVAETLYMGASVSLSVHWADVRKK